MTVIAQNRIAEVLKDEVQTVRRNLGWCLALGIVQIVTGMFAVSFAFTATLASVVTLGILLLVAAGAQTAAAIWARDWRGFLLFLLVGILYAVAGFVTLAYPLAAAESLTLLLAAAFLVGGCYRIIFALIERFPSWGWVLLNGVLTVGLGIAVLAQWPESGLWVLGLFVGIDLIFNGITWTILAATARTGMARITGH